MDSPVVLIRKELMAAASPAAQKEYLNGMKRYFSGLLSHRELALIVRSALGPHTALHNRFIRAIYTTAEHQALVKEHGPDYAKMVSTKLAKTEPPPQKEQAPKESQRDDPKPNKRREQPGPSPQPAHRPAPPVKTLWSVKYPALGNGPPFIQTSLAGGITDRLLDEDSFVAMHNRMLQLCLPTAVDAVSPDAAILLLHALGAYLKATVSGCPEASMPSMGGRSLLTSHVPPPRPFLHAGGMGDHEPEWEALETESELHDRVAREQVASAKALAQVRSSSLQTSKRRDGRGGAAASRPSDGGALALFFCTQAVTPACLTCGSIFVFG